VLVNVTDHVTEGRGILVYPPVSQAVPGPAPLPLPPGPTDTGSLPMPACTPFCTSATHLHAPPSPSGPPPLSISRTAPTGLTGTGLDPSLHPQAPLQQLTSQPLHTTHPLPSSQHLLTKGAPNKREERARGTWTGLHPSKILQSPPQAAP
jgi:hypothetical protein